MVAKPLCPLYKNIIKPLDRARYPELRYKCLVYVRNQTRHLLAMVEVPGLRDLEQRMSEALKKYDE